MASQPDLPNDDAEAILILTLRTYLQRVSSKLSATEFVELVKAAIALLTNEYSALTIGLPEGKRLLQTALQTFGTQLSQPIPPLGSTIPHPIADLVARLARHQKMMATDGVKAICATLVSQSQSLENQTSQLSPNSIRTALDQNDITIPPDLDTPAGLEDLAQVLRFERQLQLPSLNATKSEQTITEQLNQAIATFKADYQPPIALTQPRWDNELSVSSPLFNPMPSTTQPPQKMLEDETNT